MLPNEILLTGPNHAGDQDSRSWERLHGAHPMSLLTAKHKFLICNQEEKHPGHHHAGEGGGHSWDI